MCSLMPLKPIHQVEGLPPVTIAAAIGPIEEDTPGINNQ